jgi:NADP-dependent 3-hydroxy acid dehydrogenase YdfG
MMSVAVIISAKLMTVTDIRSASSQRKDRGMTGIDGKVVAITGASGGIGEAIAVHLAGHGARLVLGARRADRVEAVAARIAGSGGDVAWQQADVRRRQDLTGLVGLATERFGRLDVLVSNAGLGVTGPLDGLEVDQWDDLVDTNFKGVLYGIAAALPVFRAQGCGHFVNIISTAGLRIVPGQVVYAATKNAVRTLTEGLRQEAGPQLRVTGISPGFVHTDFAAGMTDPEQRAQTLRLRDQMAIPPEAIARAVAFAISQPDEVDVGDMVIRPTAQG